MNSIFLLIPISLIIGLAALVLLLWANKKGQFEDPEGPKYRMLDDYKPFASKHKEADQGEYKQLNRISDPEAFRPNESSE